MCTPDMSSTQPWRDKLKSGAPGRRARRTWRLQCALPRPPGRAPSLGLVKRAREGRARAGPRTSPVSPVGGSPGLRASGRKCKGCSRRRGQKEGAGGREGERDVRAAGFSLTLRLSTPSFLIFPLLSCLLFSSNTGGGTHAHAHPPHPPTPLSTRSPAPSPPTPAPAAPCARQTGRAGPRTGGREGHPRPRGSGRNTAPLPAGRRRA